MSTKKLPAPGFLRAVATAALRAIRRLARRLMGPGSGPFFAGV